MTMRSLRFFAACRCAASLTGFALKSLNAHANLAPQPSLESQMRYQIELARPAEAFGKVRDRSVII